MLCSVSLTVLSAAFAVADLFVVHGYSLVVMHSPLISYHRIHPLIMIFILSGEIELFS